MILYIFKGNLPSFEKYELFDPREEDWKATTKVPGFIPKGIRHINTLFIKGINKKDLTDEDEVIKYKDFLKRYLKLGEQLFNLSISENKLYFTPNYELSDDELNSNYIEKIILETSLTESQTKKFDSIINLRDDIEILLGTDNNIDIIYDILDVIDKLLDLTFILINELNYCIGSDIDSNLDALCGLLEEMVDNYDIYIDSHSEIKSTRDFLLSTKVEIHRLLQQVEKMALENNLNLDKKIALSVAKKNKSTKSNVYNYFEEPLLNVVFTYDQINELEKIIINFLIKNGFPYYILNEDEEKYSKMFPNLDTRKDGIIPCETLILNSIYSYMYDHLITKWHLADDRIKEIWGFDDKVSKRENIKRIEKIKRSYYYFNNKLSSNIYSFVNHKDSRKVEKRTGIKDLDDKDDFTCCDNYFKIDDGDDMYYEQEFTNLCIAVNKIMEMEEKYSYKRINDKIKPCPICHKGYIPNKDNRSCHKECADEYTRRMDNERQRRKRVNDKLRDSKGKTS